MTLLSVFYSLERLRGKKVHYNFKIHGFLTAFFRIKSNESKNGLFEFNE